MDGWGLNPDTASNAIAQARTPFVDGLYETYPNTVLTTHGTAVGLPGGQMGNSEVGHMNLGAGRVVNQELLRISLAVKSGEFFLEPALTDAFRYAAENGKRVHFIGLVSDGGVHSHIDHLKALITLADRAGVPAFIHAFTDGRDTDPRTGLGFVRDLTGFCAPTTTRLASLIGRYYGMDRDKRWPRIKLAYDLLVHGTGEATTDLAESVARSYEAGVTDEFIRPLSVRRDGAPLAVLENGDVVICFNFRTDRCRQLTEVLTQRDMPAEGMHTMDLYYVTMTRYDDSYSGVRIVYDNEVLKQTLGEVIAAHGLSQLRIAETEKYPHVTFFFSGGREEPFSRETRVMVPSPKVATYDLQPEMSAFEVRDAAVAQIRENRPDFMCLNFANTDMVGHTGVFQAAIKAAETVDACVRDVVTACLENGYTVLLTADHGNADQMVNPDGSPHTAHTLNPVPLFVISGNYRGPVREGKLADIAPTLLRIMGLDIPGAMTGKVLIDL